MQETWVQSLGWEDPLEKEMATHSSTVAWKIPWTEEPGRLQFMGSQRVGQDWATSLHFKWLLACSESCDHLHSVVALVVKNLPANAGDLRGSGSILGSGRSPGGANGNPLQYSCQGNRGNPMDRGAWWAAVLGVGKSRIRLKWLDRPAHNNGVLVLFWQACEPYGILVP